MGFSGCCGITGILDLLQKSFITLTDHFFHIKTFIESNVRYVRLGLLFKTSVFNQRERERERGNMSLIFTPIRSSA